MANTELSWMFLRRRLANIARPGHCLVVLGRCAVGAIGAGGGVVQPFDNRVEAVFW